MPPKAATLRGEQLSWISKTGHEKMTDPRVGELLDELEARDDLNEVEAANIRLARDSYDKATKLPTEFVGEMAKLHRILRPLPDSPMELVGQQPRAGPVILCGRMEEHRGSPRQGSVTNHRAEFCRRVRAIPLQEGGLRKKWNALDRKSVV